MLEIASIAIGSLVLLCLFPLLWLVLQAVKILGNAWSTSSAIAGSYTRPSAEGEPSPLQALLVNVSSDVAKSVRMAETGILSGEKRAALTANAELIEAAVRAKSAPLAILLDQIMPGWAGKAAKNPNYLSGAVALFGPEGALGGLFKVKTDGAEPVKAGAFDGLMDEIEGGA